ncbi:MAG: hypothetical protein ACRCV0_00210, partial [Brevinema sp.]
MDTKWDAVMECQKMNESILKSFDNIMFQQTKMDHKAYIFLGFLIVIFNAINKENNFEWTLSNIFVIVSSIPLLVSLTPIATNKLIKLISKNQILKLENKSYN